MAQSAAINRRSRCDSVRGWPVVSSHFSPGAAPQVGQRTASACFRLSSFFMAGEIVPQNQVQEWSILNSSGNFLQDVRHYSERMGPPKVFTVLTRLLPGGHRTNALRFVQRSRQLKNNVFSPRPCQRTCHEPNPNRLERGSRQFEQYSPVTKCLAQT